MNHNELWQKIVQEHPSFGKDDETKLTTTVGALRRLVAKAHSIVVEDMRKATSLPPGFEDLFGKGGFGKGGFK